MKRIIAALKELKSAYAAYKQFAEDGALIEDEIKLQKKELLELQEKYPYAELKRNSCKSASSTFTNPPIPKLKADLEKAETELVDLVKSIATKKNKIHELQSQQFQRNNREWRAIFYKYDDARRYYRHRISSTYDKEITLSDEERNELVEIFSGEGDEKNNKNAGLNWYSIFAGEFPISDNDELRPVFTEIRTLYFDQWLAA